MSVVKGTIAELDRKFKVGDMVLGQPELSVLTRIGEAGGFARKVGEVKRPDGKGRAATIWEIDSEFVGTITPYKP